MQEAGLGMMSSGGSGAVGGLSSGGEVSVSGDQNRQLKAEIAVHPLYEQLLAAHVSCLRVATPIDQLPLIDAQLAQSHNLLRSYASQHHQHGHSLSPHERQELDNFLAQYLIVLCTFKEQLQQHVRVHAVEAVMACREIENNLQALTGVSLGEGTGATMSDDEDEMQMDFSLDQSGSDGHDLMGFGPLVPTESERSLMERVRQELKIELKQGFNLVETEVVETVAAVEDDGAKTVEAIEESVVAVTPPPPAEKPEETASSSVEPEVVPKDEPKEEEAPPPPPEEVSIWGIPLLADERSDVILLKFLRARDFKVKDAFTMLKNTVVWRKEFGVEALLEEDLGNELEKVVFMHGFDKEGHPVCYNAYGEFQNKELYQNTFGDDEKRSKFLRWRIQFLEKSIRKLDFSPTGISTIFQVNDLKNSPGLSKRELRQATNHALNLLQDNYPEFVAKQVFINVPWWYLAFNMMISPFLTQRTKSKFVFASPAKSTDILFRFIAPEQVPVQYGGLSREGEQEFTVAEAATEDIIKPATKHTVEFPITEKSTLVWELRVVGWEVNYGAEFVPTAEEGYTVIVSKSRKVGPADETVIADSFKTGEAGKIVLTIDNQTTKKKKLLYRSKVKPDSD